MTQIWDDWTSMDKKSSNTANVENVNCKKTGIEAVAVLATTLKPFLVFKPLDSRDVRLERS
jgi:hypothetical protein